MTREQLKVIGMARNWAQKNIAGFDEPQYRLVLRNVGRVEPDASGRVSTKDLSNRQMELVMAWFESVGWSDKRFTPGYWTSKADRYSRHEISDNEIHLIEAMAAELRKTRPFDLPGFVYRMTARRIERTGDLTILTAEEAYNLIEALKAMLSREGAKTRSSSINASTELAEVNQQSTSPVLTDQEKAEIDEYSNVPF